MSPYVSLMIWINKCVTSYTILIRKAIFSSWHTKKEFIKHVVNTLFIFSSSFTFSFIVTVCTAFKCWPISLQYSTTYSNDARCEICSLFFVEKGYEKVGDFNLMLIILIFSKIKKMTKFYHQLCVEGPTLTWSNKELFSSFTNKVAKFCCIDWFVKYRVIC